MNIFQQDGKEDRNNKCFLCGSVTFRPFVVTKDYNWQVVSDVIRYVACLNCGLIRQYPMPAQEEIALFYPSIYGGGKPLSVACRNITEAEPNKSRASAIEGVVSPPAELLDVGCGAGMFMAHMHERGWGVGGMDALPENVAWVRSNLGVEDVYVGSWPNDAPKGAKYDVITMFHLLEHLRDPVKGLLKAAACLKTKGCVVIETPNVCSFPIWLFGKRCTALDAPRHLHLFSKRTLEVLLERSGFSLISIKTYSPTVMEYSESFRYLVQDMGLRHYQKAANSCDDSQAPRNQKDSDDHGRHRILTRETVVPLFHKAEKGCLKAVAQLADRAGCGNSLLAVAIKARESI